MIRKSWGAYVFWILLSTALGALSWHFSREGAALFSETAVKSILSPPNWVFAAVWSTLYLLMGVSAANIYLKPDSPERSRGLNLFMLQLTVNFFWSPIFFNACAYGFALLWLIFLLVLVYFMFRSFSKIGKFAAKLQLPYLVWLSYAALLNLRIWMLNR